MTSLMTSQKHGSTENFNFFEISKFTPSSLQNNINQKLYIFLILKMIPGSRGRVESLILVNYSQIMQKYFVIP